MKLKGTLYRSDFAETTSFFYRRGKQYWVWIAMSPKMATQASNLTFWFPLEGCRKLKWKRVRKSNPLEFLLFSGEAFDEKKIT